MECINLHSGSLEIIIIKVSFSAHFRKKNSLKVLDQVLWIFFQSALWDYINIFVVTKTQNALRKKVYINPKILTSFFSQNKFLCRHCLIWYSIIGSGYNIQYLEEKWVFQTAYFSECAITQSFITKLQYIFFFKCMGCEMK